MTIAINGINQAVPSKEDYGRAVQDITAIKVIGPSDRFDKQHVYIEDEVRPYYFDLESVSAESLPNIVEPDDAPAAGRWIKLPPMGGGVPAAHAASHTDGSDQIAAATGALNGLMTAADKTKIDSVATGADVTGANPPQAHSHVDADLPSEIAYEDEANTFDSLQIFEADVQFKDQDGTPVADRRVRVIDGLLRVTDTLGVEGRYISKASLELLTNAEIAAAAAILESKLSLDVATATLDSGKINRAGDQALTGDWDTGAFDIRPASVRGRAGDTLQFKGEDGTIGFRLQGNGDLRIFMQIRPDATNTVTLGETTFAFANVFTRGVQAESGQSFLLKDASATSVITVADAGNLTLAPTGDVVLASKLNMGGFDIDAANNIFPDADGTNILGSSTAAWGTVWSRNLRPDPGQVLSLLDLNGDGRIAFNSGQTDFNVGGLDINHSFRGDNDPTLMFLDAGLDRVGIGTAVPGTKLDVAGDITARGDIISDGDGTRSIGSATLTWGTAWVRIIRPDSGQLMVIMDSAGVRGIDIGSVETVVNELGANKDFRVEGDTDTVLLNIDGGLDRVGVGIATNAHAAKLDVDQSAVAGAVPVLRLKQTDVSEPMMLLDCTIGVGNGIEAVAAKTLTVTHFAQVEIAGVGVRYMELGTIA